MENNRLFRGLTADQLSQLPTIWQPARYLAGEPIVSEAAPNDTLFLLDEGIVRCYRRWGELPPQFLYQLEAGSFFGEVGVLDGQPPLFDAVAASDVSVRRIRQTALLQVLAGDSPVASAILRNLLTVCVERLRDLDERFSSYSSNVSLLRRYNN